MKFYQEENQAIRMADTAVRIVGFALCTTKKALPNSFRPRRVDKVRRMPCA